MVGVGEVLVTRMQRESPNIDFTEKLTAVARKHRPLTHKWVIFCGFKKENIQKRPWELSLHVEASDPYWRISEPQELPFAGTILVPFLPSFQEPGLCRNLLRAMKLNEWLIPQSRTDKERLLLHRFRCRSFEASKGHNLRLSGLCNDKFANFALCAERNQGTYSDWCSVCPKSFLPGSNPHPRPSLFQHQDLLEETELQQQSGLHKTIRSNTNSAYLHNPPTQ